jgi:hypothetical protein
VTKGGKSEYFHSMVQAAIVAHAPYRCNRSLSPRRSRDEEPAHARPAAVCSSLVPATYLANRNLADRNLANGNLADRNPANRNLTNGNFAGRNNLGRNNLASTNPTWRNGFDHANFHRLGEGGSFGRDRFGEGFGRFNQFANNNFVGAFGGGWVGPVFWPYAYTDIYLALSGGIAAMAPRSRIMGMTTSMARCSGLTPTTFW